MSASGDGHEFSKCENAPAVGIGDDGRRFRLLPGRLRSCYLQARGRSPCSDHRACTTYGRDRADNSFSGGAQIMDVFNKVAKANGMTPTEYQATNEGKEAIYAVAAANVRMLQQMNPLGDGAAHVNKHDDERADDDVSETTDECASPRFQGLKRKLQKSDLSGKAAVVAARTELKFAPRDKLGHHRTGLRLR